MRGRGATRRQRALVLALWVGLLGTFWLVARARGEGPLTLLQAWLEWVAASPYGVLLLLGLYLLRPLLLLPMTMLTVFAGFSFGPAFGFAYALAAMLVSASLAYALARFLGGGLGREGGRFLDALRERSFETVLTSRLMFVPGDVVNYASGALRVRFRPYLAGTALGGVPGLAMGVLAGASIEGGFRFDGLRVRPAYLLASFFLLAVSLGVSRWLRRQRGPGGAARPEPVEPGLPGEGPG